MNKIQITSLSLSAVALLVALLALFKSGDLGKGMDSYDFSTPEAALRSGYEMDVNNDKLAELEYSYARREKDYVEAFDSLKIHDEDSYDGKKVLFYTYEVEGKKHYNVRFYEKDVDKDMWFSTYVSTYKMPRESEMRKKIEEWEKQEVEEN